LDEVYALLRAAAARKLPVAAILDTSEVRGGREGIGQGKFGKEVMGCGLSGVRAGDRAAGGRRIRLQNLSALFKTSASAGDVSNCGPEVIANDTMTIVFKLAHNRRFC
jgi:hypothetical protein